MDHAEVNAITPTMVKRRGMTPRYIVEHYEEVEKRRQEMNMQEAIDREILNDVIRKNNEKFARVELGDYLHSSSERCESTA